MAERIDAVTIVGGGIAGWLSAVMLDHFLNTGTDAPVRITVVESPETPAPTAGETTLPSMPALLHQLGLTETEVFRRCDATFKVGVRYTDWTRDAAGEPMSYLAPHTEPPQCAGRSPALYHLAFGNGAPDYAQAALPTSILADTARAPRTLNDGDYGARAGYGYHLDADAFAHLLRETALQRGVDHVLAGIAEVERDATGAVTALTFAEGGTRPVQLVLDASGRIAGDALDEPLEAAPTLNDRVIAAHMPAPRDGGMESCTEITALSAGWAWRVPLGSRLSAGYVYSSDHLDDAGARAELLAQLGAPSSEPETAVRTLPGTFGWLRRRWMANCVAVGPAAAWHEPLDGVAVGAVDLAIRRLITYWPDRGDVDALRERYNTVMRNLDREIADFAGTHYRLSNRADTAYWRAAAGTAPVSPAHAANLRLWETSLPGPDDLTRNALFRAPTYTMLLFGTGHYQGRDLPRSRDLRERDWAEFRRKVEGAKMQIQRNLPEQGALLAAMCGDGGKQGARRMPAGADQPAAP